LIVSGCADNSNLCRMMSYSNAAYTTRGVASGATTMPYAGASYTGATSYASVPSYAGMPTRGVAGATSYTTAAPTIVSQPAATYASQPTYISQPAYTTQAPTIVNGTMSAGLGATTYAPQSFVSSIAPQSFGSISNFAPQTTYVTGGATTYAAPMNGMYPGTVQATYLGGATATAASAGLLAAGRIVSERVVSLEECYNSGLVRPEAGVQYLEQPAMVETVQTGFVETVGPTGQLEMVEVQTVLEQPVEVLEQPAEEQPAGPPRVVIVCTSSDTLGDQPSGAWSEEITGPYYVFLEAGCEIYIASIAGGQVPIDQASLAEGAYTENDRRFQEEGGIQFLENSFALSDIQAEAIDCVWLAGGHGTCMDFENNLAQFVTDAIAYGRPVGAVCHGVCGLLGAINQDGTPLLQGKQCTGFSNAEEDAVGLSDKVPFLVQQRMEELGALYSAGECWSEYAVADGQIITGQNPQSSVRAAQLCIQAMMPPQ